MLNHHIFATTGYIISFCNKDGRLILKK